MTGIIGFHSKSHLLIPHILYYISFYDLFQDIYRIIFPIIRKIYDIIFMSDHNDGR